MAQLSVADSLAANPAATFITAVAALIMLLIIAAAVVHLWQDRH